VNGQTRPDRSIQPIQPIQPVRVNQSNGGNRPPMQISLPPPQKKTQQKSTISKQQTWNQSLNEADRLRPESNKKKWLNID